MNLPSSTQHQFTDEALILSYQKCNDQLAFETLFKRYSHLVFCVCQKYLRNEAESQDAVMEIFSKLLHELKRHQISAFKGWIYSFTKNHCLMKLRKADGRQKHVSDPDEWDAANVRDEFETLLQETPYEIRNLRAALAKLNTAQKTCVQLFFLEKKSYRDISKISGYSVRQVKSHIQNGKRNLRIILKQSGDYHEQ